MGLDVYLYRYEDREATERLEAEASEFSEKAWDIGVKYANMTDAQKDACRLACKEFNEVRGLDESGDDSERKQRVRIDYPNAPDHYFKIGYFRSSYNNSGINRIMRVAIGETLDTIMGAGEEYAFQPDWPASLARAEGALRRWQEKVAAEGSYRVIELEASRMFASPDAPKIDGPESALRRFVDVKRKHEGRDDDWKSFSDGTGSYWLDSKPPVFRAFITGTSRMLNHERPCVYAVYEDDGVAWCWTALEIVAETCRYVLSQPDPEKYYLHWSG